MAFSLTKAFDAFNRPSLTVADVAMNRPEYLPLDCVPPAEYLPLLNKGRVRQHLIDHPLFDEVAVAAWLAAKLEVDATPGCKVRAIRVNGQLAGWCGLQFEQGQYEIAVVLDDSCWGLGRQVFAEVMGWARAFGHQTVYIHFLHTRPEYRFLRKIARQVTTSEMMGNRFTTYELVVD